VRGAVFGELDVRALRSSLVAAGDDAYVENRPANIPHSIVAPSILLDELEVKRANRNKEKLPGLPGSGCEIENRVSADSVAPLSRQGCRRATTRLQTLPLLLLPPGARDKA
jgi:hypothetical protein